MPMPLLVKAKYNNDLRRFRLPPTEDGSALSLAELRSKICDLFQFNPSAQFVITYVDEGNDSVTMADDGDLLDALEQDLNPLRLEVSLMSENNRATGKQAQSQPSTPRKFSITREQGQAFDLRSICSEEILKVVTKDLRKAILKRTKEIANLASNAAVAELIEDVVKLVSTRLGPVMERQQTGGAGTGTQSNSNAQPTSGDPFIPSPQLPSRQAHGFGLKGNQRLGENMRGPIHKDAYCKRCGTRPIIGPRDKSLAKDDYDLCQSCFSDVGKEGEYEKLDRAVSSPPAPNRSPHEEHSFRKGRRYPKSPVDRPFKYRALTRSPGCSNSNSPTSIYGSQGPSAGKPAKKAPGKLDCRFICFVQNATTGNGTQFAPGTPFTRICRLRNTGTQKWPYQTQLVRISEEDFGAGEVVNLQIQEEGYEVGKELDVAVNFVAPIEPGRYTSRWRLEAPSGHKFGKVVWILIEVVPREECSLELLGSLLTLDDGEQKNLTQEQTKQKTVDFSSQDISERACLGYSKMDLDPNELGCSSLVADKGKQPSSLVEVGNAFTQSQRVDSNRNARSQHGINVSNAI